MPETVQHYLVAGVNGDDLIWAWLCDGHAGDPCRPDGECQVIDFWYGMSDHGCYRTSGDELELISFTGRLDGQRFLEDPAGPDALTFRMRDEYMELAVNGNRVADAECDIRQAGIFPVSADIETYKEFWGESEPGEPEGWLWGLTGKPLRTAHGDALWPHLEALEWDYQASRTRSAGAEALFQTLRTATA